MSILKSTLIFIVVLFVVSCSNKEPSVVSELGKLQIPVVQPFPLSKSVDQAKIIAIYSKNDRAINALSFLLKSKYLSNANSKDIFDVYSLPHKVYKSLTNLEQAASINTQYYNEKNIDGLKMINEVLQPFEKKVEIK